MAAAPPGPENELQEKGGVATQIRDEKPEDAAAIRAVVEAAFPQPAEADLVDQLRADGDSVISLVAVDDGKVVGHIVFSKLTAPFRALGLAPVSVLPDRQNAGIGSRLIQAGLDRAVQDGWQGAFVLGEPEYYCRFGFEGVRQGLCLALCRPILHGAGAEPRTSRDRGRGRTRAGLCGFRIELGGKAETVCPSFEATRPRCLSEGCPGGPVRASDKEDVSWGMIA
jgi:putative acetyltransferase